MEGVDYRNFDIVVNKIYILFQGMLRDPEVHSQNKKSILAYEDPKTIFTYNYEGQIYVFHKQDRCGWNTAS